MRKALFLFLTILFTVFGGCKKDNQPELKPGAHQITILESIPVSTYTYARIKDADKEYWMAFSKQEVKAGQTFYYSRGMEMQNFTSKELNRTFPSIVFVEDLTDQPMVIESAKGPVAKKVPEMMTQPQKPVIQKEEIKVGKVSGGVTIAQIYENRKKYDGKTIKIKGKVTKYNAGIMQKNWVHFQDGTGSGNSFDLTITTNDEVNVGDVVTFEGKIALNKDFGYGYSYEVLLEDAVVKK